MLAAPPTVAVIAAAADEVSVGIAQLFSQHSQGYQAAGAQGAAFHDQFVKRLATGAFTYTSVEPAIASFLRSFLKDLSMTVSQGIWNALASASANPLVDTILGVGLPTVLYVGAALIVFAYSGQVLPPEANSFSARFVWSWPFAGGAR